MLIFGHRGARGHAPENTMASFRTALEMGVDGIELDVPGTGMRRYIGDSHVWAWYRGSSVGPYPCMSALLALERFIDHMLESLDIPARTIRVVLTDAELAERRKKEAAKGSMAFQPVDRQRPISTALRAYALFAASADKGAVRILPK